MGDFVTGAELIGDIDGAGVVGDIDGGGVAGVGLADGDIVKS